MAVITVDPGGGADHTTIAAAIAAAGAADEIEILASIDEQVSLSKNIAEIRGTSKSIIWSHSSNTNGEVLGILSGLTQAFLHRDITIQQNNNGVGVRWTGIGSGSSIEIRDVKFDQPGGLDGIRVSSNMNAANQLLVQRCEFVGGATAKSGYRNQNNTVANAVRIQNCLFRGGWAEAIRLDQNTSNSTHDIFNCTINTDGSGTGILVNGRGNFDNNLFTNNGTDVTIGGSADAADFTFCAFEQQGSPFGSDNIFSIVSTDEYVDEGANNFHLKTGAQSKDAGKDLSGTVDDDFDGNTRPMGPSYDIGAFEFFVAVSGPPVGSLATMGIGR